MSKGGKRSLTPFDYLSGAMWLKAIGQLYLDWALVIVNQSITDLMQEIAFH